MYIKQLQSWTHKDWQQFIQDKHIENAEEVMQILTGDKNLIESNFNTLTKAWIINGIWPWYFPASFRYIITLLFPEVRYEFHDIMYAIWWTEIDRLEADNWLLKYSLKWLYKTIENIDKNISNNFIKILALAIYFLSLIISVPTIIICYVIVRAFGRFSFRYIIK